MEQLKTIDVNAPIVPYEGMGGIKLYSTKEELQYIFSNNTVNIDTFEEWEIYDIDEILRLYFHSGNCKLFKIITGAKYKGKLWGRIDIHTTEEEFSQIEPTFVYDDFEEVWESSKGVFIETDPVTHEAMWISVFIPELLTDEFDKAKW